MAIKIIREPSKTFRLECKNCGALLEYEFGDILSTYTIKCPCCDFWNDTSLRKIMPKESEEEGK